MPNDLKKLLYFKNYNENQLIALNFLIQELIPKSSDGFMPSAVDLGLSYKILQQVEIEWLFQGLEEIDYISTELYGKSFIELESEDRRNLIKIMKSKLFRFFGNLGQILIQYYFLNEQVIKALGSEFRAPFPDGYHIKDGDLSLLENVYIREKIYRD